MTLTVELYSFVLADYIVHVIPKEDLAGWWVGFDFIHLIVLV